MTQPTFDQDSFRGRDDDVGLNSATFNGGGALNADWTQLSDVKFRVRFLIQETAAASNVDQSHTLWFSYNSGSYEVIGGTGAEVVPDESSQYTTGDTTTQVIGAGTYTTGDCEGGVETGVVTGNIDIDASSEHEVEFCIAIVGSIVSEGDTIDLRVRRSNGTVLDSYTRTPRITVTKPPEPDNTAYTGDPVFEAGSFTDLYTTAGWSADNEYFEQGNILTHPSSDQPTLVKAVGNSLRMKAEGVAAPGLFPAGADDTITKTVTGLSAGKYVYEYYQVSHDDGTRTTRLLSGAGATEVLLITGDEADGDTTWQGPFHHVFTHLGGDLVIEVYYDTVAVPSDSNTGIKDTAIIIREYVGFTLGLTAEASATEGEAEDPPEEEEEAATSTGFILKLLHGPDTLNLQAGRYCVDEASFAAPTTMRAVTYGAAAIGSVPTSKERVNRTWKFAVNVIASTNASEAERALRELQSFLNRAGGSTPLYAAYRNYGDYDFEPFFGLAGAFARFEIVDGRAQMANAAFPAVETGYIARIDVTLTIKPQSVYPGLPSGQATGGIFEDYIGRVDGKPRGTWLAEATTNKFTNPVFMASTFSTGWTASSAAASENKDGRFVLFGDTSARLDRTGSSARYTQTINVGDTETYAISFYVKLASSGNINTSVSAYYNTTLQTNRVSLGDGWYWCWGTATGAASNQETGVVFTGISESVYVDGFQIEAKTQPTLLCHGDLLGCTWSGTKNASTSSRSGTGASLRYFFSEIVGVRAGFTYRVVWRPYFSSVIGQSTLFSDESADIRAHIDSSEAYTFATDTGSGITSDPVTLTPGTPEILHFTFDGTTSRIYRAGALIKAGATTLGADALTYTHVGNHLGQLQLNAPIQGFAVFRSAMSAAQVLADYNAVKEQAEDGERIDPLPWVWTPDGDNIVDNDNDGTLNNFCVIGGLMGDDVETAYKLDSSNSFVLGAGVTWGSLPVDQREMDKDILTAGGTNTLLFVNGSGPADTDANGDAVTRISLSTSTTASMATAVTPTGARLLRNAFSVTGYFVAKDASTNTNVQVQAQVMLGDNQETYYSSRWRTLATSDAFRPFITSEMPLGFGDPILNSQRKIGFRFRFRRQAGASTENFDISHAIWLVNYSSVYTADVGNTVGVDMCYVSGRAWEGVDDANPTLTIGRRLFNRPLYIRPELLNVLMLQHTSDNFSASKTIWTTGYNLEIEQFVTTPRFDIF